MNHTYTPGDTIAAISTPKGSGGIAVIRISGSRALEIAGAVWNGKDLKKCGSHTAHLGQILDAGGSAIDEAVATVYLAGKSFTGEPTVEYSIHGSVWLQKEVMGLLLKAGARLANRGEFTQRAVANGRIDLVQAEGIADMISSSSKASHKIAFSQMKGEFSKKLSDLREKLLKLSILLELELDFSEEDVEFADRTELLTLSSEITKETHRLVSSFKSGQAIRNGVTVAIIGKPNSGKSSLLNGLLEYNRAIVSNIPGTTRDTIEEEMEIGDYRVRFVDTAGIRSTDDELEKLGIERSKHAAETAPIVIEVIDGTLKDNSHFDKEEEELIEDKQSKSERLESSKSGQRKLKVINKIDKWGSERNKLITEDILKEEIYISAKTGEGIGALREKIKETLKDIYEERGGEEDIIITNLRHVQALERALESSKETEEALRTGLSADIVSQNIRHTTAVLGEITGAITTPEILTQIFSAFCIGK